MNGPEAGPRVIDSERPARSAVRGGTLQSHTNLALTGSLIGVVAIGILAWYYSHAMQRRAVPRQGVDARPETAMASNAPLPSIGPVNPPAAFAVAEVPAATARPLEVPAGEAGALAAAPVSAQTAIRSAGYSTVPPKGADRALAGPVFAAESSPRTTIPSVLQASGGSDSAQHAQSPSATAVRAQLESASRLVLPKGAFIDCTLETAIDSSLPGITTCVTATDTFGVDGDVVLLERGTKLVGEIKGETTQGAARLFVLWTEARTPSGVLVPLDSPGADELGRAGMAGTVNRHFWQRFGAAMLVSIIDGAVQATVESANRGGAAVVVSPGATQGVATEVLKSTVNIPPTVVKRNGDRIQVIVARDLDFRSVYTLRIQGGGG